MYCCCIATATDPCCRRGRTVVLNATPSTWSTVLLFVAHNRKTRRVTVARLIAKRYVARRRCVSITLLGYSAAVLTIFCAYPNTQKTPTQRAHDTIIIATSFWRQNDVIFASCVRWAIVFQCHIHFCRDIWIFCSTRHILPHIIRAFAPFLWTILHQYVYFHTISSWGSPCGQTTSRLVIAYLT